MTEMEPGLRVTGSQGQRSGSGRGSVCQNRRLTRFWVLTCTFIVALFLLFLSRYCFKTLNNRIGSGHRVKSYWVGSGL